MSAELVDPFARWEPVSLEWYDDMRDVINPEVIYNKAFLPAAFDFLVASLGTRAMTRCEGAEFAAGLLAVVKLHAQSGADMFDPQGGL